MTVREQIVKDRAQEGVTLSYVELTSEFEEIREYVLHKGEKMTVYAEGREAVNVRVEDILYFEAVGEYVFAYLEEQMYEVKLRLYQVEEKLQNTSFLRASKSVLMNVNHILSVRPALNGRFYAKMKNGEDVLISRNYAKQITKRIMEDGYERV